MANLGATGFQKLWCKRAAGSELDTDMAAKSNSLRPAAAALLVASAVLFAIATSVERSGHQEVPAPAVHGSGEAGHSETGEKSAHSEAPHTETAHSEAETLFGVDIESPLFVGVGVVLSLILAALALRWIDRRAFVVIGLFALAFAALDAREVFHMIDESRAGLAGLAGVIALIHLTIVAIAHHQWRATAEV
jgi:hypothetical protein